MRRRLLPHLGHRQAREPPRAVRRSRARPKYRRVSGRRCAVEGLNRCVLRCVHADSVDLYSSLGDAIGNAGRHEHAEKREAPGLLVRDLVDNREDRRQLRGLDGVLKHLRLLRSRPLVSHVLPRPLIVKECQRSHETLIEEVAHLCRRSPDLHVDEDPVLRI